MSVSLSSIAGMNPPAPKKRRLGKTVMSSRVSYRPLLVGAYEYFQKEMLNELINLKPKTHYQTVTNQVKTKQKNNGDVRMANKRKYLDNVKGYDRSEMQKQFHEVFTSCGASFV